MVLDTPADPGKLSPEIGPTGAGTGFDDAMDDCVVASSERPHDVSANVPADSAATPKK
jgi:hypothetical protein